MAERFGGVQMPVKGMGLRDIMAKEKGNILDGWYNLILETYPPESRVFLKKKSDQFANPIGHTISASIEGILEGLLCNGAQEQMAVMLSDIIRIMAIQDCSPSDTILLILLLKRTLRDTTRGYVKGDQLFSELLAFEDKIDRLTLLSFDIFMKCREDVFNLKVNELKRSTFMIAKRLKSEGAETL
ncbi:MAG: RsbRD N-terminal domain-containing protein [Nitrospirae bacterium]|nr:RsbRD N-terminal domain-containing protein [Nitrospirota bacterium]